MTMQWRLFGVAANSATVDDDGCSWTVASSDGWDAPDQGTQFAPLTGRDGQSATNPYAEGRPVVIRGLIFAPTDDAAWAAYDRVTSTMPGLRGSGDIIAYEPTPKSLTVLQAGPPRVTKPLDRKLNYWLTLNGKYPWKRALVPTTVTVAGGATVSHTAAGTFAAELEVTLTSGGTVDLSIAGQRLRTGTLPSGAVLTSGPGFAHRQRTIVSSTGSNLFGQVVQPMQWPAISPGSNSLHQAGTAGLSVRYYPTYA